MKENGLISWEKDETNLSNVKMSKFKITVNLLVGVLAKLNSF